MPTTETSNLPSVENCDDWSDPLVGLQVNAFSSFVNQQIPLWNNKAAPDGLVDVAEHLCEWSRNLLNRTFGRTTPLEMGAITEMFAKTADHIDQFSMDATDSEEKRRIQSFATHIRERTGMVRTALNFKTPAD